MAETSPFSTGDREGGVAQANVFNIVRVLVRKALQGRGLAEGERMLADPSDLVMSDPFMTPERAALLEQRKAAAGEEVKSLLDSLRGIEDLSGEPTPEDVKGLEALGRRPGRPKPGEVAEPGQEGVLPEGVRRPSTEFAKRKSAQLEQRPDPVEQRVRELKFKEQATGEPQGDVIRALRDMASQGVTPTSEEVAGVEKGMQPQQKLRMQDMMQEQGSSIEAAQSLVDKLTKPSASPERLLETAEAQRLKEGGVSVEEPHIFAGFESPTFVGQILSDIEGDGLLPAGHMFTDASTGETVLRVFPREAGKTGISGSVDIGFKDSISALRWASANLTRDMREFLSPDRALAIARSQAVSMDKTAEEILRP